jgi:TPP-dependent pyruvate/acetoin dehydrogenase alpha subunit
MSAQLEAFKRMVLLRVAEEEIANLYLRDKLMSFVHFYVGQEAVAVGVSNPSVPSESALDHHHSRLSYGRFQTLSRRFAP